MSAALHSFISIRNILLQVLLVAVCLLGDFLIKTDVRWKRALFDTLTHGCIALVSWTIISGVLHEKPALLASVLCGLLAMAVDVDHFIEARSLHLEKALNLQRRPFLHSTSTVIVISISLGVFIKYLHTYWKVSLLDYVPWMCFTAWVSHHLRDAHRRGLWFLPFGSTPPLPQWMYVGLLLLLVWSVTSVLYYRNVVNGVSVTYTVGKNVNLGSIIEL